jgi:hypothetical protein
MKFESSYLPTFLVVGPGRSGTSWMYEMLKAHPEVCLAKNTKETLYFDRMYEEGAEWYKEFFKPCEDAKAIGELSNTYIYNADVPRRVYETLGQVDLIVCLREPYERLRSSFAYKKRAGEVSESLEKILRTDKGEELIRENLYDEQLDRFLEFFSRERIHIFFYDDLKADPVAFLQSLYRVLGVDDAFLPEDVERVINKREKARIPGSGRVFGAISKTLRKIRAYGLLTRLKRNESLRRVFVKEGEGKEEELSPETLEMLKERFDPMIERIESLTGRDLEGWKDPLKS